MCNESTNIRTGVYAIVNDIDGGMYIGSSKNIDNRFNRHMSFCRGNKGETGSYNLKQAVEKYGEKNFFLVFLESCEVGMLLEREKFWIERLNPSYNVSMNPLKPMQSRNRDRLKPKELWKHGSHRQSEETRRKISSTMKGKAPSKQCLEKAAEIRKKKVILECIGCEPIVFDTVTECANYLGISIKHASLIKHDNTLFRKRFKIKDYVQMA